MVVVEGTSFAESDDETSVGRGPDEHAAVGDMVDKILSARDADIVRRVAAGDSYTDAAARHGVGRERARQIEFITLRRLRAAIRRPEWAHVAELKKSSATLWV
jgi:DNA-directed RNA polymerase sigma subunit (sigma70/sigma32)